MQLILVRHGDAGAYTLPDHERNLSALGQAQAHRPQRGFAENFEPDHFIVSPYNRAQQTLAKIQQFFPHVLWPRMRASPLITMQTSQWMR